MSGYKSAFISPRQLPEQVSTLGLGPASAQFLGPRPHVGMELSPTVRNHLDLRLGQGMYEATNFSTNRATRIVRATDSRFDLTQWTRLRAMALARWSYINVPYIRGAVDLMMGLSVGTGFAPNSLSKDKVLALELDAFINEKFETIGFANNESMDELLQHDCRGVDIDGDIGYNMVVDELGNEKLQLVEAHRIKRGPVTDPLCIDGVWFDQYARRTGYNILLPDFSEGLLDRNIQTEAIPVGNFIYLAERNRPDEPRSITNLIHALNPLQDLYEILAFEMASVKKNSEIGLTIETDTPNRPPLGPPVDIFIPAAEACGDQPAQPAQIITREQVYGGGGKVAVLKTGEKLQAHDHKRPGTGIEGWSKFTIRGVSVGFGLPFEILWDPESIGGANTRLITSLLRARLQRRRKFVIFPKLQRTRSWLISREPAFRMQAERNPRDVFRVEWLPKFLDITVDAGRESRERRANVQGGLDTYTGYFADNGANYLTEQLPVRAAEIEAQCVEAEKLAAKFKWLDANIALSRIAMLTPNANEAIAADQAPSAAPPLTPPKPQAP